MELFPVPCIFIEAGFWRNIKNNLGYHLITGGSFGPEAGLLGLVVVILAFVVVFWWMQSR
jgi:uncharacterized membrane protein